MRFGLTMLLNLFRMAAACFVLPVTIACLRSCCGCEVVVMLEGGAPLVVVVV